jgi:hypothetical protein
VLHRIALAVGSEWCQIPPSYPCDRVVHTQLLSVHIGQILPRAIDNLTSAPTRCILPSGIGQVLMDQPHRHSALANRGGTPLDRATAHIASREYSRQARFQKEWLPRSCLPGALIERRTVQLPARQDEAALVEFNGTFQPAGVGLSSDEDEERPGIEGSTRT